MFHLRLVSLFGLAALLGVCYLFSQDRKAISWRLVGTGLLIQAVLGTLFLYWKTGNAWLRSVGDGVKNFLDLSQEGTLFVFGALGDQEALEAVLPGNAFVFATQVLPTLIFFSALMAVLYHLGIMQAIVRAMARAVVKLLGTSGVESLSACKQVFKSVRSVVAHEPRVASVASAQSLSTNPSALSSALATLSLPSGSVEV